MPEYLLARLFVTKKHTTLLEVADLSAVYSNCVDSPVINPSDTYVFLSVQVYGLLSVGVSIPTQPNILLSKLPAQAQPSSALLLNFLLIPAFMFFYAVSSLYEMSFFIFFQVSVKSYLYQEVLFYCSRPWCLIPITAAHD